MPCLEYIKSLDIYVYSILPESEFVMSSYCKFCIYTQPVNLKFTI